MLSNYSTYIAGVWHHCKESDNGYYDGYVVSENNPYDPHAIAVYTNAGKKVGYIPRAETRVFRFWSNGVEKMPCKLRIVINPEYPRQSISEINFDSPELSHTASEKYAGKSVHLSGQFLNIFGVKNALENSGMIVNSRLRRDTDYVIYDEGLTDSVSQKHNDDKYHFESLYAPKFLGEVFSTSEIDFRGKEIAFAHNSIDYLSDLLKSELMFYGATIVPKYRRSTTDIVVIPEKGASYSQAEKALTDGKTVMSEYELLSMFGNISILPEEHKRRLKSGNDYKWKDSELSSPETSTAKSEPKLTQTIQISIPANNTKKSGCLSVVVLAMLVGIAWIII